MTWDFILPPLANIFGFIALVLYFITLQPGFFRVIHPIFLKNKILVYFTKYRRQIGITAFLSGLAHALLLIYQKNINLLEIDTYKSYWPGITLITIFGILALTSNQWSVSHLKQNWKRLHQLTFVVMFILVYHILDKVKVWTYLTPIGILILSIAIILFTWKKLEEWEKQRKLANAKHDL